METEKLAPSFISALPRRNKTGYAFLRVSIGYVLIFIAALILGVMFFILFSKDLLSNESIASYTLSHFTDVFNGCTSCKDYFTVIIAASAPDLRYLFLIFTSGFTYFCGIATSAFALCRGFTFGFSLGYLYLMCNTYSQSKSICVVFFIFELVTAALMIFLSTKSLIFGYDFRKLRVRRSRLISSPTIYSYMLLYLTAFGLILIINTVSCFVSLLLY